MENNNSKKRECQFAVVCNTGEKPDSAIHIAAFREKDGINVVQHIEGYLGDQMHMACSLVSSVAKAFKEKGGIFGVDLVINEVLDAVKDGVGIDAMKEVALIRAKQTDLNAVLERARADIEKMNPNAEASDN